MSDYPLLNGHSDCLGAGVTDENNNALSMADKIHQSYWDVTDPLVHIPILLSKTVSEKCLRDIIPVGLNFALSEKFQGELKRFRVDENAAMQPVKIVNNKLRTLSTSYVLLYSRKWYDVLDLVASGAKIFPSGRIDEIQEWVLSAQKIPELDLFCTHGWHWIVSGRLAESLTNMTNIRLKKIKVQV